MPKASALLPGDENYVAFLQELKSRIRSAQVKAAIAVNQELIVLYWQIGRDIVERQQIQGWGAKVIDQLAKDLKREFPDMTGLSVRNLKYMRSFAEAYPRLEIVQRSVAQLPWRHNIALLEKVKKPTERIWYAQKALEHGWSRDVLVLQIESKLYQRQGGAVTNFEHTLPSVQSDLTQQLLKDPYNFEFLTLREDAQERELEQALVQRIRDFLLELGVGFAFLGSQYRLEVSGEEYFIDLLFYHVKLHCYVVIDLKVTEFRPEYAGKMNFYVTAVNQLLCDARDSPTIGIVLCRSKNRTVVEYALSTVQNPIGVATYQLRDTLPPELKDSLPTAAELEQEFETALSDLEQPSDSEK